MPEHLNLFEVRDRFLAKMQKRHTAREVIYARAPATVSLRAVVDRSQWNIDDGAGLLMRVETRDFLIEPGDLMLDGLVTTPEPGDRITDGESVYEVSSPGPGLAHYSAASAHQMRHRVHTKYVGAAP